jgi:hypothetical protein
VLISFPCAGAQRATDGKVALKGTGGKGSGWIGRHYAAAPMPARTAYPRARPAARLRALCPEQRVLAVMLMLGFLLRLLLWLEWRPAFLGFSDSGGYLVNSNHGKGLFTAALRSPGYPVALRLIRGVSDNLAFVTAVQHLLGLAAVPLIYSAVVRLGASPRWALLPAGALAFSGALIFLENAIMAETVFTFLFAAALWLASRAADGRRTWAVGNLSAAAGLLLGWAAITRTVAVPIVPLLALWLAWAAGGARGRRAAAGLPALVTGTAVIVATLLAAHAQLGSYSFARNEAYQTYGRVAPFADCRAFDPPAGTRALCPATDARTRPGHDVWTFDVTVSPLVKRFGVAGAAIPLPDLAKVAAFSRAAILGQPKAYARAVGRDLVRVIDPSFPFNPDPAIGNTGEGCEPQCMIDLMQEPVGEKLARAFGPQPPAPTHHARATFIRSWERSTRITGLPMLLLLLLALGAPVLAAGRARRGAVLLAVSAVVVIVFPILVLSYDWRYVVAAFAPLTGAAAIGATALTARLLARRDERRVA